MFLILTLIMLVAALNIISGLIMLVKDKTRRHRDPAHHGRDRGAMMRVFMIAGASIGVVGTLIGFVIGVVFCANIEIDPAGPLARSPARRCSIPTIYFLEPHAGATWSRARSRPSCSWR